jgi:hypothetical protein
MEADIVYTGERDLLMNRMDIERLKESAENKVGGKRVKNKESLEKMKNEWRGNCYWLEKVGLYCPAENIEANLFEAAKKIQLGRGTMKQIAMRNLTVKEPCVPIQCSKTFKSLDEVMKAGWVDERVARQQMTPVVRHRVMIPVPWKVAFTLLVTDESEMDKKNLVDILAWGGKLGLMDWRPKFGTFEPEVIAWRD